MASGLYKFIREIDRQIDREFDEGESELERFAGPPVSSPVFDVACTGCADRNCIPMLRSAINEAIRLAQVAADKLETASVIMPEGRNKTGAETAQAFRTFFCHDPSRPVPWAGNEASGLSVAKRLRAVARELGGGRRLLFECRPFREDCPRGDATCCGKDMNGRSVPGTSTVGLCPDFWDDPQLPRLPNVSRRAGTIIHEMLHLLFAKHGVSATRTTREIPATGILDEGPKRANAHCYKAFVLRVNRLGDDPLASEGCGRC